MSDNSLRDRIAAVLGKHWAGASGYDCKCGWETTPMRALSDDYEKHVADAVIRELGLPPTWGKPSFENGRTDQVDTPTRYVTKWISEVNDGR